MQAQGTGRPRSSPRASSPPTRRSRPTRRRLNSPPPRPPRRCRLHRSAPVWPGRVVHLRRRHLPAWAHQLWRARGGPVVAPDTQHHAAHAAGVIAHGHGAVRWGWWGGVVRCDGVRCGVCGGGALVRWGGGVGVRRRHAAALVMRRSAVDRGFDGLLNVTGHPLPHPLVSAHLPTRQNPLPAACPPTPHCPRRSPRRAWRWRWPAWAAWASFTTTTRSRSSCTRWVCVGGGRGGSFTFGELHLVGVVGGRTVGVESGMWVVWQAGHGVWRRAGF